MTDTIFFQNSDMLWPVMVIGVLIWMVFVWKEWSKPVTKFFYLNSLVALITVVTVAILALKPQAISNNSDMGVLLTNGFEQKQLDSLEKSQKGLKIYPYQENLPMKKVLDSLGGIYILGDGIKSFDFWQFENRSVHYLGANSPEGIIRLKYPKENILGDDLVLKGRYRMPKAKNRLVLENGDEVGLDSVQFKGNEFEDFKVKIPLKATGKFAFQLIEKDSLGTHISSNPIPFKVSPRSNLRIVVINSFPSFETKYLKNYLAEMGHEVVVRSQLTKGRYKFEYLNTSKKPMYRLDESTLKNFDLMIINTNSFRSLSGSAKTAVKNSVKKEGLGLFIQPDEGLSRLSKQQLGFKLESDRTTKVVLDDFSKRNWVKFNYMFENTLGLEEIHRADKKIVTGYKRLERGRVGMTLIQNTYQLQLEGKKDIYQQFWTSIIKKLSKKNIAQTVWGLAQPFPLQNEPYPFELHTSVEKPKVFTQGGNQIALKQNIDVPTHWNGITYPKSKGWNELRLQSDSSQVAAFYITDTSSWKSLLQYNLQKENERFFDNAPNILKQSSSYKPLKRFWFFLIGLLGLSYLWLYPKVFQN